MPLDVMKPIHIVLFILLIAISIFLWPKALSPIEEESVAVHSVEFHPLEETILPVEPSLSQEEPRIIEGLVAVEEPLQPVQTLEERGDAMLFEIDALQGTPFDQAIVMPFE